MLSFIGSACLVWLQPSFAQALHEVEFGVEYESPIFLRSGDITLTDADIDAAMERIPEADRAGFLVDPKRISGLSENVLLTHLWAHEFLLTEATEVPATQAILHEAIVLRAAQLAREQFIKQIELDDYTGLARELYLSQPELFQAEAKVDFEQVLIEMSEDKDESVGMEGILQLYVAASKEKSLIGLPDQIFEESRSDVSAGAFKSVSPSDLIESVGAQISQLQEGSLSQPFRSEYGWHLIRVLKRHDSETPSWDEVASTAMNMARERHIAKQLELKIRDLQDRPVQFGDDAVRSLQERFGASEILEKLRGSDDG